MGFREEGKWWVAPANYREEVLKELNFVDNIKILDTTLRDGEQQPGVIFNKEDKIALAKQIDSLGVHKMELGTPAASKEDEEAIREICKLGLNAQTFAFVRNIVSDVELAKDCGVDGVLAEVPGSDHLIKGGMGWTVEKAIAAAAKATARAHELGLYVTFFPADGSRADLDFLLNTLQGILDQGGHMDSIVLVDTFGVLSPDGAKFMIKTLKEKFNCPIEAHFHEDFGMSVATTIAALSAGAEVAHVTVNGIGERVGNCPIEPLALSLEALYGIDTGIDLKKLLPVSREVAIRSNFPTPPTKAVIGTRIFGWETGMPSGLWKNAREIDPLIMLPYHWDLTGQEAPKIYMGKKSGNANIQMWLEDLGMTLAEEHHAELLDKIKNYSISVKRDITEEEFKKFVSEFN
ncbi:LeuA family protein [Vagococcus fluvialis]|uniref:Pyruvate carboxyltransferase n=1 Tax=Vagococcus fluvialis TaxID=2738 RepID=A0A7X6DA26_9ENTE|nr:pyruvate carboxyltransferase [Vagococcus fluvialis]NKC68555.1 pyruvate carboxyltransferase [Vagococcus fluvialis]